MSACLTTDFMVMSGLFRPFPCMNGCCWQESGCAKHLLKSGGGTFTKDEGRFAPPVHKGEGVPASHSR